MQKKGVLILFLLLSTSLVLAQTNSTNSTVSVQSGSSDVVSKAYQCLQTQIDGKAENSISLQEAIFGVLALGSNSKLISVIESKAIGSNHWSDSSNQIKDTSQVLLAYNKAGRNTDSIESWLLSNRKPATDLTWYLEVDVDNHVNSQCSVSYAGGQYSVNVNEDMTLSGNPGSCLAIAAGGFWLRVNNNCIDNNFTFSCDKDFTTSTVYQRTGSSTVFVSPVAHSTAASGSTIESIHSKCLSTTATCDYEGTLWAALALDKSNNDISEYLPYLLALSESNKKLLPSSFLYILTEGQDQYSELVQLQQQSKFWQAPNSPYNRYYDSALALLSLDSTSSIESSNSKAYFETIVTPEGCWNNNNIRDTAFLLYSGWPRLTSTGGGSGGNAQACESAGYSCTSLFTCNDLQGEVFETYRCPGTSVCCSQAPLIESCLSQNGNICTSAQSCSGTTVQSTEGSCCLGTCTSLPQSDACEQAGGGCYSSCNTNEEQLSAVCSDSAKVCCRSLTTSSSGSNVGIWITILIILIALIVAGILLRNKLKFWIFKSRNKSGKSKSPPSGPGGRPPFPPAFRGPIPYPRAQPRVISSSNMPSRRPAPRDKEMEETMAKLKEMSK